MNTSKTKPSITPKYHIEVPTHTYMSPPCVYKVWFGKSYFIWKGKSLLLSATWLAEGIERALRLENIDDTNYLWYVYKYIKKTRCLKAFVEVMDSDLIKEGSTTAIDVYRMLKTEQNLLKEASGDILCLNNNEQAYIAKWMEQDASADVAKFRRNWDK